MPKTAILPVVVETCARAAHEVNRAYCLAEGDTSQAPWEDAPENIRESARAGVRHAVEEGLDTVQPRDSHESWLAFKRAEGWVWGPTKDAAAKTHPCMVPYAELPPAQRAKDALFLGTVRTMLAAFAAAEVG